MRFLALLAFLLIAATPAHAQLKNGRVVASCGAPALTAGPVDQVTQDTTGRACMGEVAFGGPCAAATNYLARTTGGNEGGNSAAIQNLICGLVSDGVITGDLSGATGCGTYLDGLYIFAQQNAADAKLNLCGTSYPLTVDAGTIFQTYVGFNNFPTGMITGFNLSSAVGKKWALNSASFGVWAYSVVQEVNSVAGSATATNVSMFIRFSATQFFARVNQGATPAVTPQGASGLYVGDRPSASTSNHYWNGTMIGSQSVASNVLDNANMVFGKTTGAATTMTLSEGHMGASLGPTLELALYNRLRIYMSAVGVP